MTTRRDVFTAGLAVFVGVQSLAQHETNSRLDARGGHLNDRIEALGSRLSQTEQRASDRRLELANQQLVLTQEDRSLGARIDAVADNVASIETATRRDRTNLRETGENVEDVLARLGDVEVAVGMPGSDVIIEPEVDLIRPSQTLKNCQSEFTSIDWQQHRSWAIDGIKRGWSCRRMGASLVRAGHVKGTDAIAVCATLYPSLPWSNNQRRVQRWSRGGVECHSLAQLLKEKSK